MGETADGRGGGVNTCATCKWWENDCRDPAVAGVHVMRRCRIVLHMEDDPESDGVPDKRDVAYVSDASGYTASLNTAGHFGCTLWKGFHE